MSNAIRFLETMGRDVGAGALESAQFHSRVGAVEIDPSVRQALAAGDVAALTAMLGGRESMMMLLMPSEPDNEQPDEEKAPEKEVRAAA